MANLDQLRLTQILSPAFPIGAFAHSQGLEWAIAQGHVRNGPDLQVWVEAVLAFGSGRSDAVFVSMARRPGADLNALADLYAAYLPAAERAIEAAELGRGFRGLTQPEGPVLPYALAVGRETARLVVAETDILSLFLQALAMQLVSVAVRFLPLGQSEGQRIVAALAPTITRVAAACSGAGQEALVTFTPGADIAAMAHETMETRIFRS